MALIEIEGMEFYAFHGHYKEEQIAVSYTHLTLPTNREV